MILVVGRPRTRVLCNSREWVKQEQSAMIQLRGHTFLPLSQYSVSRALDRPRCAPIDPSLVCHPHFRRRPRNALCEKRVRISLV